MTKDIYLDLWKKSDIERVKEKEQAQMCEEEAERHKPGFVSVFLEELMI